MPLKNDGWKTILSYWRFGNFSGAMLNFRWVIIIINVSKHTSHINDYGCRGNPFRTAVLETKKVYPTWWMTSSLCTEVHYYYSILRYMKDFPQKVDKSTYSFKLANNIPFLGGGDSGWEKINLSEKPRQVLWCLKTRQWWNQCTKMDMKTMKTLLKFMNSYHIWRILFVVFHFAKCDDSPTEASSSWEPKS